MSSPTNPTAVPPAAHPEPVDAPKLAEPVGEADLAPKDPAAPVEEVIRASTTATTTAASPKQEAIPAHTDAAGDELPEKTDTGAATPAAETAAGSEAAAIGPVWPTLDADHPLSLLVKELPSILEKADYAEVYGVQLKADTPFHTKLILQKFLRANSNVVPKAKEQLLATLKWRKEYQPLKALEETFSEELFGGLGFVTLVEKVPGSTKDKEVVTYNVYGAVKDIQKTFGNVDTFLRWRVALMELGISKLSLATATEPIPDFGKGADQYQGIQVHDYKSISFLRQDPHIKAASKQTIDLFSKYYPETLSKKFFLNVPLVMSWLFTFFKALLPSATTKKFSVISYGTSLTSELGPDIPKEYGGKAGALDSVSETVKLAKGVEETAKVETPVKTPKPVTAATEAPELETVPEAGKPE